MISTEVLIVGGGAAGLSASMLLSSYGVKSRLVSRYQDTSPLPKAHLLSIKTMEIFREVGVEAAIRAQSCPDQHMRYVGWYAGLDGADPDHGREIARLAAWGRGRQDSAWAQVSDNGYTNLPQARLEPLLRDRAEQLASGSLHFYQQFESLQEDESGIVATILDRASGQRYQVRAQYLLACDGGQSVGPQLGVTMEGHLGVATNISVHFSGRLPTGRHGGSDDVLNRTILNPDTGQLGVLVPMGPAQWGDQASEWVFNMVSFHGDHKEYDDATAVANLRRTLGLTDTVLEVHQVSRWPLNAVVASRMRVGRSFILGDAAHRMPPSGAHGLNTAVQDAYNLCWKLALVLGGKAGKGLLDSYEPERLQVARATVDSAYTNWENARRFAVAVGFSPDHTPQQNWDHIRLQWAPGSDGDAARGRAAEALAGVMPTYNHINVNFGHAYASGALIADLVDAPAPLDAIVDFHPSTKPGHSVLHAWLDGTRGRYALNELIGRGRFVLIAGEEGAAWCEAARKLALQRGIEIDAFTIGVRHGERFDFQHEWLKQREYGPSGAILVRPDHFVAWRAMALAHDPEATLGAVFAQLLGEGSGRRGADT